MTLINQQPCHAYCCRFNYFNGGPLTCLVLCTYSSGLGGAPGGESDLPRMYDWCLSIMGADEAALLLSAIISECAIAADRIVLDPDTWRSNFAETGGVAVMGPDVGLANFTVTSGNASNSHNYQLPGELTLLCTALACFCSVNDIYTIMIIPHATER